MSVRRSAVVTEVRVGQKVSRSPQFAAGELVGGFTTVTAREVIPVSASVAKIKLTLADGGEITKMSYDMIWVEV